MTYVFADCRFDVESRTLERGDESLHLTPKAFEVLRLLIEARPRVVTKAELMSQLWPETFVTESNLPILVGEVRHAIADDTKASRLIKTHHAVGYAFIGDVKTLASRSAESGDAAPLAVLTIGRRRVVLFAGENVIGRDLGVDVRLNDLSVSKRHARVILGSSVVTVEDLQSKNGTFVDDAAIDRVIPLETGARLRFGSVHAEFEIVTTSKASTVTAGVESGIAIDARTPRSSAPRQNGSS